MKRILITVLITLFCFGIGATSFVVNDLSSYVKWYQTELKPNMDKNKKDKEQMRRQEQQLEKNGKRQESKDDDGKEHNRPVVPKQDDMNHDNAPVAAPTNSTTSVAPAAPAAPNTNNGAVNIQ